MFATEGCKGFAVDTFYIAVLFRVMIALVAIISQFAILLLLHVNSFTATECILVCILARVMALFITLITVYYAVLAFLINLFLPSMFWVFEILCLEIDVPHRLLLGVFS